MNKIYKKIFNKARGCFVAVSEVASSVSKGKAKVSVLVAGALLAPLALYGQELIIEDGDYTTGDLIGYDNIQVIKYAKNVTFGSINSPNAILKSGGVKTSPSDKTVISAPRITVNGDTTVKAVVAQAHEYNFNGNVTVIGKIDKSEITTEPKDDSAIEGSNTYKLANLDALREKGGTFESSSGYDWENGGVDIQGNLNASLVVVSGAYFLTNDKSDYYSILRVKGDLNADNLLVDSLIDYDDYNDYLSVGGTTTITQDLQNNGVLELNKAVIQGKFFSATGEYMGTEYSDGIGKTSAKINELDTGYIYNGALLKVSKFLRTSDVIFNQKNGQTESTANWLDNSIITLTGGILDTDKLGVEQSLGTNNTYTVSGGTLATKNLGTGSKVTVSDSGIFKTTTDIAFKDYLPVQMGLNITGLNSSDETTKEILTERFVKFNPGTLADQFANDVSFTNGTLSIYDAHLTETQVESLKKAFKSKIYSLFPA